MKKIIIAFILLPLLLLLNGCLTTLHPIFTIRDLVADNRMTGDWKKSKDGSLSVYRKAHAEELSGFSATLSQNADKVYRVTIKEGDDNPAREYFAFLVKLDKNYYLDYYPVDRKASGTAATFFSAQFIPMHTIYRVDFYNKNSFALRQLDAGFLDKLIKNKQIRISHTEMDDGGYVITASTKELQQYLIKYGDVADAYGTNEAIAYTKIN